MSPAVARLAGFLVLAARARHVAAIAPEPEALRALERAAAQAGARLTRLDDGDASDPSRLGDASLVYLGPTASPPEPMPASVLLVHAEPRSTPSGVDVGAGTVRAWAPIGPAADAPGLALAMAGVAPTAEAMAALEAIATASDRERPTDPVPPEVGRLLYLLARARRSRRALELGTSAGAAAIWLASAVAPSGGRLTTIERDSSRRSLAARNVRLAGLEEVVDLRIGEAARLVPKLEPGVDLVFFDEAAEDRLDDLAAVLERVSRGALLVAQSDPAKHDLLAGVAAVLRTDPRIRTTANVAVGQGLELAVVA